MEDLLSDLDLRFVFVGGKGGVGKTTSSASIATCFAARQDYNRVLLISTDPAHSLGDAFMQKFEKGVPTLVAGPSTMTNTASCSSTNHTPFNLTGTLHVLEVDPHTSLEQEIAEWCEICSDIDGIGDTMQEFQQWLRDVPGIDEATAISNVINFIEEDRYDIVVFDTAPTGHTLKLLNLPKILSQGMEKLQSWNTTLWTYWDLMMQPGSASSSSSDGKPKKTASDTKYALETRLQDYKLSMDKIGRMLQDHRRTQFVTVCIAEYLSVMETERLLAELLEKEVRAGIVICNQLLPRLELSESEQLELTKNKNSNNSRALRLIQSRNNIQSKYLNLLQSVKGVHTIIPIELQDKEITGLHENGLLQFASMLLRNSGTGDATGLKGDSGLTIKNLESKLQGRSSFKNGAKEGRGAMLYPDLELEAKKNIVFPVGCNVEVFGLAKTPQYNGVIGVIKSYDEKAERYGVFLKNPLPTTSASQKPSAKLLALKPVNLKRVPELGSGGSTGTGGTGLMSGPNVNGINSADTVLPTHPLLRDPDISEFLDNHKLWDAYMECKSDPSKIKRYLDDGEVSEMLEVASQKIAQYQKNVCGG